MKIYLVGGLGNQLFQIAKALDLLSQYGGSVALSDKFLAKNVPVTRELVFPETVSKLHESGTFKRLSEAIIYRNLNPAVRSYTSSRRLQIPSLPGCHNYYGYFQEYEIVYRNKKQILELFSNLIPMPSDKIVSTAIHIRGGDYLDSSLYFRLTSAYYSNAIQKILESSEINQIDVFSNDKKLATKIISTLGEIFGPSIIFKFENRPTNPIHDLIQISKYANIVTANSTFSWWAGFLGEQSFSKVHYPSKYFTNEELPNNLYPPHWEKHEV